MQFASALQEKTGKGYVSASSLKYAVPSSKDFDMMAWELNMKGELKKTGKHFTLVVCMTCSYLSPRMFGTSMSF